MLYVPLKWEWGKNAGATSEKREKKTLGTQQQNESQWGCETNNPFGSGMEGVREREKEIEAGVPMKRKEKKRKEKHSIQVLDTSEWKDKKIPTNDEGAKRKKLTEEKNRS
jgi:hypothetical protein